MTDDPTPVATDLAAHLDRLRRTVGTAPPPAAEGAGLAIDRPSEAEQRVARWDRVEHLIPERFRRAVVADAPPGAVDLVNRWLEQPEPGNLVIVGSVGAGKTHVATAAARSRVAAGPGSLVWTTVKDLADNLRDREQPQAYDRAVHAGVLLCDDIGAERATDWSAEQFAAIVDARWSGLRPIVATSNLTLGPEGSLIEFLGDRTYSRLVGSGAVVIVLNEADRRRS